ncbi:hypothetical protein JHK87_006700 [Glycine soja]|nr:hypothetical protein JHK87_006700 [Glycine soja]
MLFVIRDKTKVPNLKQQFYHSIAPGGLAGDRRGVVPASGFSFSAQEIWKIIKENKDLDLPAHKDWCELEEAVLSGPISGFGKSSIHSLLLVFQRGIKVLHNERNHGDPLSLYLRALCQEGPMELAVAGVSTANKPESQLPIDL